MKEQHLRPLFASRFKRHGGVAARVVLMLVAGTAKEDERRFAEEGRKDAEKLLSQEGSSVSWIRYRGESRFRREAKEGDLIVCIWTEEGGKKPSAVYHHAPIRLRRNDEEHDLTFFYVEEYPDTEETKITWKQFQRLYSQVGIPGKLGQWTTR